MRIKAYSRFKTKGCRTRLKKEASKAFDIAGTLSLETHLVIELAFEHPRWMAAPKPKCFPNSHK